MRWKHAILVLVMVTLSISALSSDFEKDILDKCLPQTGNFATAVDSDSGPLLYDPNLARAPRYEEEVPQSGSPNSSHVASDPAAVRCPQRILHNRPHCRQLNFSSPVRGHVFYDPASTHYSYEPDACVLRRLTADQALRCLAKAGPLLFLGE
jgi:hypothetical protein